NRCATAASISCDGMREASTASGWRRSIIWSMRARKKSSVAGQANMAVKLPENNRHWTTNWEFRVSDKPPTTNVYAGHEDFSGTTIYLLRLIDFLRRVIQLRYLQTEVISTAHI